MTLPDGFEEFYSNENKWLCIMKLKQAGLYYYSKAKRAVQAHGFEQSDADPCLFFTWKPEGIIIRVTWLDDNIFITPP